MIYLVFKYAILFGLHRRIVTTGIMFLDIIHRLVLSPEIGASSIHWIQLSRFYLKTETESSLRNVVVFLKNRRRWIMSKNLILVIIYHQVRR
jgi:hypothetical protein